MSETKQVRATYRLLILAIGMIVSYLVGFHNGKYPDASLVRSQQKLLNIYVDYEWRTDNLLYTVDVDSNSSEFQDYYKMKIKLSEFYNDPNNDQITMMLNE